MRIHRYYTEAGKDPYSMFEYELRDVIVGDPDNPVFQFKGAEVPKQWSQQATDILVSKYFRRRGVPKSFPTWGYDVPMSSNGSEYSIRQIVHRMVYTWTVFGQRQKLFDTEEDARAYYDEMTYSILNQMGAPNTPQWFNTGLGLVYGIHHDANGQYFYVDDQTGNTVEAKNIYERQQVSACFIQGVEDSMFGDEGIYGLVVKEARMFALGSGTGTNFSKLRGVGEPLSHGGYSSGLMSFLRIFDRSADSVKSGGKTRRAAKMVCLDDNHPELMDFINWKSQEEDKALALIRQGYDNHFEGEAYKTVAGQNSNNSVRFTNKFFQALEGDGDWNLINRIGGTVSKTLKAKQVWDAAVLAAWRCADPGIQLHDTINEWHTCAADGEIRASNPCSEYMFLDETSCNLASIRVAKFWDPKTRTFDVNGYMHAVALWTITLENSVAAGLFPSKEIAQGTYDYRTLGLGVADVGGLLMRMAIPYDSKTGRALAACLMSIMSGWAYAMSAVMAKEIGTYSRYEANRGHHLRVIRNHARAAYNESADSYEGLTVIPQGIDADAVPRDMKELLAATQYCWDEAYELGVMYGYRNAQATVIAPTGTIGIVMDCDTLSAEPDFSLKKFKKLAGGGGMKIVNQAVPAALEYLGYSPSEVKAIVDYVDVHGMVEGSPVLDPEHYPVFDCAVAAPGGTRFVHYMGHLEMMGALQPFVSGAISKTVNLPEDTTPEQISKVYLKAKDLMIKAVALYRNNCKSSQPLNVDKKDKPVVEVPENEGRVFPPDITDMVMGVDWSEPEMVKAAPCKNCGADPDAMVPAGSCQVCLKCGTSNGGCA